MYILKKDYSMFWYTSIYTYIHIHTHTHTLPLWLHTHPAVQQYSSRVYSRGTGERGGPGSVTVMADRRGDRRGLKQHVVSFLLRGNLCSLFKVTTPLRWKILRFPNVTQCAVQLTTHVCWLLNTHTQNIHVLTHIPNIVG